MYAIVALGLVLLTGIGGLTSFGQAAFVGLGAYSTAYLSTRFGISLDSGRKMYYLIWALLLVALLGVQNLLNSRLGRAIRALNGGGVMAEAMGVNTAWIKIVIFVLAALLASVSGWLYAHLQRALARS